ncbi:MAG TPA: type I-C CRISPR-associated protein Cas5c [Phycisphaerae bacterium]|nr:type I-C CRISPR-associated protein Cas5c [Phycisphaerae bacterium]
MSYGIKLHVWGDYALFTRPEMKVERVSYDFLTPSAARAIVSAIYWKPEIRWIIDEIHVLKPIRFISLRRNEVGSKIRAGAVSSAMKKGAGNLGLFIEEERQQRAAMILRDVAYVIAAHFEIVGGEANEAKHLDQFNRRAREGKCFMRPYLGCREFAADFALAQDPASLPKPHESFLAEKDYGWMLHDIDYAHDNHPRFFRAIMRDGIVKVPPFESDEVRE